MLLNSRAAGANCTYDRGQEEGNFEDSHVVQEEHRGYGQGDMVRKTALQLCGIDLVKEGGLTQTLRLDTIYSELLLLFAEPADGFRTVCQCDEGYKGESNCHHPFNSEDPYAR